MFKILFGKKLQKLYDELERTKREHKEEVEYLNKQLDNFIGNKDCITGEHCRVCKNSYDIGFGMTPIHIVTYGCKLKIPCEKFEDRK